MHQHIGRRVEQSGGDERDILCLVLFGYIRICISGACAMQQTKRHVTSCDSISTDESFRSQGPLRRKRQSGALGGEALEARIGDTSCLRHVAAAAVVATITTALDARLTTSKVKSGSDK
eukprot:TRINITY_DN1844_c0_g1_i4.p1 TRINITY_DN1844_c0_g1~~TRINITY_DN1844_c0_g1_i4.p1  ORF type:complete len:119 (-),score=12.66 TRINITY_DN1844_c0_g1_i4:25-381(-)